MINKILRPSKQSGQAMAEFVAVISVFFVMMWGISYIAKIGSISQNMQEAARHAAFERTVWLEAAVTSDYGAVVQGDANIQQSVQHHFFTGTVTRCEFCETPTPDSIFWTDLAGNPLISSISNIIVSTSDGSSLIDAQADVANVIDKVTNAVYSFVGAGSGTGLGQSGVIFAVDQNGLYKSNVQAQVNLPAPFNALATTLNFTSSTTLLADEWYAGGSTSTGGRAIHKMQGLVPMALLETPQMEDLYNDLKEINQFFNLFGAGTTFGGGIVFGNISDKDAAEDRQELIAKVNATGEGNNTIQWQDAVRYGKQYSAALTGSPPNAPPLKPFKLMREYEYIPSVAAMTAEPIELGYIDPANKIFELLP